MLAPYTASLYCGQVASFHFLSQLKLRSAINLSAEPLHEKALEFFRSAGVTMVRYMPGNGDI